jgi:hypothetical protein
MIIEQRSLNVPEIISNPLVNLPEGVKVSQQLIKKNLHRVSESLGIFEE